MFKFHNNSLLNTTIGAFIRGECGTSGAMIAKTEQKDPVLPSWFIGLVGALCLFPPAICLCLFLFGSTTFVAWLSQPNEVENAVLQTLLISWGSVWTAGAIITVGFLHYRSSRSASTLVITIVFAAAAFSDALESSVLLREAIRMGASAPARGFTEMNWLRSLSHLGCLLLGVAGFAWVTERNSWRRYLWFALMGGAGLFVMGEYAGFYHLLASFASELNTAGPSVIFCFALIVTIGPLWYHIRQLNAQEPSIFHEGLRLAMLPLAMTEALQAFIAHDIFDAFEIVSQWEQLLLYITVFGAVGLDTQCGNEGNEFSLDEVPGHMPGHHTLQLEQGAESFNLIQT